MPFLGVLIASCANDWPPRDERLEEIAVPFQASIELSVARTPWFREEAVPVGSDVEVVVLTPTALRVPARQLAVEAGATSTLRFSFEPPGPGVFDVTIDWGKKVGRTTQNVFVVDALDETSDEQITYAYRIENCQTVQRALVRTFCEENGEVFVYDASGQYEQTIPGRELRAVGAEVWVNQAAGLSHWTDLGSALRFDGTVELTLLTAPHGETRAGKATRPSSIGLVEVTWDGSRLVSRTIESPTLPILNEVVFLDGEDLMRVGPGTLCRDPKIPTAPGGTVEMSSCENVFAVSIEPGRVWFETVLDNGSLLAAFRDRSSLRGPNGFVRVPRTTASNAPWTTRPDFVAFNIPAWNIAWGISEFPTLDPGGERAGWLREWRHDGLLVAASDDWLISRVGPNSLRFHAMR